MATAGFTPSQTHQGNSQSKIVRLIPIHLNYETDVNPEREVSLSFLIALAERGVSPLRIALA
ncbi:hypothetical protein CK516_00810 [Nostoc sp. 'Peltigera malacea cyanobiont' DB3992]|nr:hypothetical protein CK516_00810 [Nostoc sp. 'Peltigera malacea cyanobiont' DB3992]